MASQVPNSHQRGSGSFQKIADAFLAGEGLPFAEILSAQRIERVFAKHGCLFGRHGIYTSAIMVRTRAKKRASRHCCARCFSLRKQAISQ